MKVNWNLVCYLVDNAYPSEKKTNKKSTNLYQYTKIRILLFAYWIIIAKCAYTVMFNNKYFNMKTFIY